jgi:hypothetical protein
MMSSLKRGSVGCGFCSGHIADHGEAFAVMRAAGFEPLEPYPGANIAWTCRHAGCGLTVRPTYWTVRAGHGCRWCSGSGFKAHEAAIVYLVTHDSYDATKVGIADAARGRLKKHRDRGWQVAFVLDVPGQAAQAIETNILDWWRDDLHLPIHLGRLEMPQGGWTETAATSELDLAATIVRIRALAAKFLSAVA